MPSDSKHLSLSGEWKFALDPDDQGRARQWFLRPEQFTATVLVPGALQAQGLGDNRYCTPPCQARGIPPMVMEKTSYLGTAWYQREFRVPETWRGKTLLLVFGGTHPIAEIWIDDHWVAAHKGSFLEHRHDITPYITAGAAHTVTVRLAEFERTMNINKRNNGAVEGGTFNITTWSGIWRDVRLEAKASSWIDRVLITPDVTGGRAVFKIRRAGREQAGGTWRVAVVDGDGKPAARQEMSVADGMEMALPLRAVKLWSPESPHLYRARITLLDGEGHVMDETTERFGMREVAVDGQHILLNGKPVFLRGYGDDQLYVHTLSPVLDRRMLEKDLRRAKDYGFNFVDFLGSVPHKEYLDMADETGLLIQCYPVYLTENADPWYAEPDYAERVIGQLYNHPSVAIYSVAAEKYGHAPDLVRKIEALRKTVADIDSTRLLITTGGISRGEAARDRTDILEMAGEFGCVPERVNVCRKPVILHEYRWWSSYPDSRLKDKYTRSALRPFYIEYAEQVAAEKGMLGLLPVFVEHSQKFQAMERKLGLERARRNPGVKGYALWLGKDLKEAVEGVWDDFGDPKNVSADAFRESNGETVLLIAQDELYRCYWSFEDIPVEMWASHFGPAPIADGSIAWRLESAADHAVLAEGRLDGIVCPAGANARVAEFRIRPEPVGQPVRAVLRARLEAGALTVSNRWDFWLFPSLGEQAAEEKRDLEGNLLPDAGSGEARVFTNIDDDFMKCLAGGGRIILLAAGQFKERYAAFKSIAWNSGLEGQSGTVVENHPALGDFPHEGYGGWQFFAMLKTAKAIDLDAWPAKIKPIIRAIASYKTCYNMGHLFEVKTGKSRVLVTTMDFSTTWDAYPTSSVEKIYLLHQLKKYAAGDLFQPEAEVPASFFESVKRISA